MKSKIKIPLVIFILLMVLAMTGITIYYFNTREESKLNDTVNNETVKKDLSKESEEMQNVVPTENDSSSDVEIKEESKENSKSDNQKEDNSNNSNNTVKTETPKNNNSSSKNNTTSKSEQDNQTSSNTSSSQPNSSNNTQTKEEPKTDENVTNDTNKEEQNNTNIYEVPDEDNKDNVSSFENDEEYIKLKAMMEFETRAECQAASDIIGPQYALQGNLRNTSCESFAYKGTVIGYRLLIWFTDGTWKYNNS